jgi:hypothetical protein
MAYSVSNPIRRLGPQGAGNSVWLYVDGDALATIDSANYFNDEVNKLNVDDVIIAVGNHVMGITVVNANSGTAVDVNSFTAISTADSD